MMATGPHFAAVPDLATRSLTVRRVAEFAHDGEMIG
jgi:hypothetical protein